MQKYFCGPLQIISHVDDPILRDKVEETLSLYNVRWGNFDLSINLDITRVNKSGEKLAGNYIKSNRMWVNSTSRGLGVYFEAGGYGEYYSAENSWKVNITNPEDRGLVDIEDLMGLVLTTGWRKLGWVPMHAGAIAKDNRCFILCAESGGGKSTLSAAMLHLGWGSLGDDKLLLRIGKNNLPELCALMHNFNLHPQTANWFPEVGDLERLPSYSVWTPKRRVSIDSIWPGQCLNAARPTHQVRVELNEHGSGFKLSELNREDSLNLLLRQTVIPKDRKTAAQILSVLTHTSQQLSGLNLVIGQDAYSDPADLYGLESQLISSFIASNN